MNCNSYFMEVSIGNFNIYGDQEGRSELPELRVTLSFAESYFKNLAAFEPITSKKNLFKSLDKISRDINIGIDRKNIIYIVTDNGFSQEEEKYIPMRVKGFFQIAGEEKIKEFQNSAYNFVKEKYGFRIDMDLVE